MDRMYGRKRLPYWRDDDMWWTERNGRRGSLKRAKRRIERHRESQLFRRELREA